jgi:hypothetical protein
MKSPGLFYAGVKVLSLFDIRCKPVGQAKSRQMSMKILAQRPEDAKNWGLSGKMFDQRLAN